MPHMGSENEVVMERQLVNAKIKLTIQSKIKACNNFLKPFKNLPLKNICIIQHIKKMQTQNDLNRNDEQKIIKYTQLLSFRTNHCFRSFAFNKISTIAFLGGAGDIKMVGFNNNKKIIQKLIDHKNYKFNQLVSGTQSSITLWNQNQNNLWQPYQKFFKEHDFLLITRLILNKEEDLLVAIIDNKKIQFWNRVWNLSWFFQQTINDQDQPLCLSINTQNKVIVCEYAQLIKVIEFMPNDQWTFTQEISISSICLQITFINDNQFFIRPNNEKLLVIFNYEQETQQFIQAKQIETQSSENFDFVWQSQFIEQKQILVDCYGNFFGKDKNGEFVLQKFLKFDQCAYGKLTDNGEYLITWNKGSFAIQVRKFYYFE